MKITISWKAPDENGKTRLHSKEFNPRGIENDADAVEWAAKQIERLGVKDPDVEFKKE